MYPHLSVSGGGGAVSSPALEAPRRCGGSQGTTAATLAWALERETIIREV